MTLMQQVEKIVESSGFDYCLYDGCFNIAARRNFTMFLKVLVNVDSFQESQANNLKIISESMGAAVGVVGLRTRREELDNDVLYERFGVPAFTPRMLESIIYNDMPLISRGRGGLFAEIDAVKLRKRRNAAGMTQQELARLVGVTKKSIYEHEKANKKADLNIVKKIEMLVGEVTNRQSLDRAYSFERNEPKSAFELAVSRDLEHIGFGIDFVYQSPFNLMVKDSKIVLISRADDNKKRLEKDSPFISELSSVTSVPAVVITKDEINIEVPSITENDLKHMKKSGDIKKFIQ